MDGTRIAAGWSAEDDRHNLAGRHVILVERVIDAGQRIEIAQRTEASTVEVPDSLPDGPTLGVPVIAGGERRVR